MKEKQNWIKEMELLASKIEKPIPNSVFIQLVCDIAQQITADRFNDQESVWNELEQSYEYTEEAQDFFNNKYDEIEQMLICEFKLKVDFINQ